MALILHDTSYVHVPLLRKLACAYFGELALYRQMSPFQVLLVDAWMQDIRTQVYLVQNQDEVCGFIVVVDSPHLPGVSGNYLAEFYIAPQYRRSCTALLAGGALMHQFPGAWTADVLCENRRSLRFVRAMTARYGHKVSERSVETAAGSAHRFRWIGG